MTQDEKQAVFDRVYRGLASQGWRQSIADAGRSCLYRGPNGLKCAAGHLIPDDLYNGRMEGSSFSHVVHTHGGFPDYKNNNVLAHFVDMLQRVHDHGNTDVLLVAKALSPEELKSAFNAFASKNGLTIPMDVVIERVVTS